MSDTPPQKPIPLPINDPRWTCPICNQQPQGDNFRLSFVETRSDLRLIDWIRGDMRTGLFCVPEGQSIERVEDLLGHITTFEGCLECFSKTLEQNPLARSIFKLFWHILIKNKLTHPQHAGHTIVAKF